MCVEELTRRRKSKQLVKCGNNRLSGKKHFNRRANQQRSPIARACRRKPTRRVSRVSNALRGSPRTSRSSPEKRTARHRQEREVAWSSRGFGFRYPAAPCVSSCCSTSGVPFRLLNTDIVGCWPWYCRGGLKKSFGAEIRFRMSRHFFFFFFASAASFAARGCDFFVVFCDFFAVCMEDRHVIRHRSCARCLASGNLEP